MQLVTHSTRFGYALLGCPPVGAVQTEVASGHAFNQIWLNFPMPSFRSSANRRCILWRERVFSLVSTIVCKCIDLLPLSRRRHQINDKYLAFKCLLLSILGSSQLPCAINARGPQKKRSNLIEWLQGNWLLPCGSIFSSCSFLCAAESSSFQVTRTGRIKGERFEHMNFLCLAARLAARIRRKNSL